MYTKAQMDRQMLKEIFEKKVVRPDDKRAIVANWSKSASRASIGPASY